MRVEEIREHLTNDIIPFWKHLRDDENGGYYGWMDYEHKLDKRAVKGCILNSRITWFFANAYTLLKDESLLDEARHGFEFLKNHCWDKENGGVFWSVKYDGTPIIRLFPSMHFLLIMKQAEIRKLWIWLISFMV